jgi:large-conductance mechanosensitive channel
MAAQKDAVDPAAPPPPPTKDQELLMEIRDLLKKK